MRVNFSLNVSAAPLDPDIFLALLKLSVKLFAKKWLELITSDKGLNLYLAATLAMQAK